MGAFLSPPPPHTPSPEAPRDSPDPLFTSPPTSTRLLADEREPSLTGGGGAAPWLGARGPRRSLSEVKGRVGGCWDGSWGPLPQYPALKTSWDLESGRLRPQQSEVRPSHPMEPTSYG